jgi:REP element-mobilizing transposase RayT
VHAPGGFYHVTARGNHREDLFETLPDRDALDALVSDALIRYGAKVHAYCWMTNHIHLFIQIGEDPLGKVMQRIEMRFARYRHQIMNTRGHLFEKRHGAQLVDADNYFMQVVRYIHRNPVEARMVDDPTDYEWSSHRAYLGFEKIPWLTTDHGLSLFSNELGRARSAFHKFVSGISEAIDYTALTKDPRILGSPAFADSIPTYTPPRAPSPVTLDALAKTFCAKNAVSPVLLRSRSRRRDLTPLRVALARKAIDTGAGTCSDVARYLGRCPSALGHLLARYPADPSMVATEDEESGLV